MQYHVSKVDFGNSPGTEKKKTGTLATTSRRNAIMTLEVILNTMLLT